MIHNHTTEISFARFRLQMVHTSSQNAMVDVGCQRCQHCWLLRLWPPTATPTRTLIGVHDLPDERSEKRSHLCEEMCPHQSSLCDPFASKRDSEIQKRSRLIQLLQKRRVELVILSHIERLTTPSGTKLLLGEIEWLRHLFANEIKTIPLVLVGPPRMLEQIQTTNTQFCLPPLVSPGF